jgi:tRNA(adenine34) deaminase
MQVKDYILNSVMTERVREDLMREALREAEKSLEKGEVPVGCVITRVDGKIVGRGHNTPLSSVDPSAHAEINALREAAKNLGNYRLPDCLAFVTLEPCPMCAGALVNGRIKEVYFGAKDPKGGGLVSLYGIGTDNRLNHSVVVVGGILEEECQRLLREFFRAKR